MAELYQPSLLSYINDTLKDYFLFLELPEEIQALVVQRVAGNSFQDLYGLRASCKLIKALADRRIKTSYAERNPSTLYMKGVQFLFTFNLQEEGFAFMKLAADEGYEHAVYTYAMTRKMFWGDEEYFAHFTRESVDRIGKLVRSLNGHVVLFMVTSFRQRGTSSF
ncbi:unnamed protein product, partial [Brassica oleracea var. botrytis]